MKKMEKEKKCPSSEGHLFWEGGRLCFCTFPYRSALCSFHRDWLLTECGHLEIFVKVIYQETNQTITLAVDPDDSIANLKSIINAKKGFLVDEQRIVYNGRKLGDDRTVSDYNIPNKSTLNLVLRVPGRHNGHNRLEVTILTEARGPVATYTLAVRPTDSILEVKLKIRDMTGVPPQKQILNFADRELENTRIISDYNIRNDSVIYLVEKIEVCLVFSSTQEIMALELRPNDTVESVKEKIHAKIKISPYRQILQFNGEPLDDVHSLNYYNIENKSMLFLYLAVEIFVKMSTGIDVRFKLIKSNTIKNLKERIQHNQDIPCDMQRLYFLRRLLEDKYALSDYSIKNGSVLNCNVLLISVNVKMPNEDDISVDVCPEDKVRSVIDKIQARVAIPPDHQCLMYNGIKLTHCRTLRYYQIRNGSVLDLVKSGVGNLDLRIDGEAQRPRESSSNQPSTQAVFNRIVDRCFEHVDVSNPNELNGLLTYLEKVRKVLVLDVKTGSLIFTLECGSLKILDDLWQDYITGHLNEVAQRYLVTNDILKEFGLSSFKLASNIKEEDYRTCQQRLIIDANQMLDRLRTELHDAFRHWLPVRRNTKEKLEEFARNLPSLLRKPDISTAFAASAASAVVGGLAAPFTFGVSLMAAAAGAGIGALIGGSTWYRSAEEGKIFMIVRVQRAIDTDRRACVKLQEQLDSLKETFTSTTSEGAMIRNVSDALTRASRFADTSVLPRDIIQLVKSSLDRNQGSTAPIVEEIRSILSNLKCPDETEIQRLVEESLIH